MNSRTHASVEGQVDILWKVPWGCGIGWTIPWDRGMGWTIYGISGQPSKSGRVTGSVHVGLVGVRSMSGDRCHGD